MNSWKLMEIVNKSFRRVRRANQGLWAMSDGSWVSDGFMTQDSRLFTQTVGTTLDRKRRPSAKPSWRSWSAPPKVGADSLDLLEMYWLYLDDFSEPLD